MSVSEVIKHFETVEILPIDIADVITEIRRYSKVEEVYWFAADINPEIVRGFFVAWSYPSEWKYTRDSSGIYVTQCADVYYSMHDPVEWQRFVSCKEAFHLLDTAQSLVDDISKLDTLIDKVVLPPELQTPLKDGAAINTDRAAELYATAVLLPMAARNLLLPRYRTRDLLAIDIARLADVPQRWIPLVMSPMWEVIHAILVGSPVEEKVSCKEL